MNNRICILFDFDGTICNSLHAYLDAYNSIASDYNLENITVEQLYDFRNKSVPVIANLLNIPKTLVPVMLYRLHQEVYEEVKLLKPVDGIQQILNDFSRHGFLIGIISSNKTQYIENFFYYHQLCKVEFIYCSSAFFKKDFLIKKAIKHHQLDPAKILLIGDEIRDIQAAQKVAIRNIAVTWGANSRAALIETQPDKIIDSPAELTPELIEDLLGLKR